MNSDGNHQSVLKLISRSNPTPSRATARAVFWGRFCNDSGAEIVESALMMSVFLSLLIGMIWIGRGYNVYQTISRAAREGARFAVAPSCATCGNAFPSDTEVQGVINGALSASALDPTKVSPAIVIQRNTILDPTDPAGSQFPGVIVSLGYPVKLTIPFTSLNATTATLKAQAQMRQEF